MVRTTSFLPLFLSSLMVHSSMSKPTPDAPIVEQLLCDLCKLTTLPFPCESPGLAYAVQSHPFNNRDSTYSSVKIQYFHTQKPFQSTSGTRPQTGFTKRIGWDAPSDRKEYSIYGGIPIFNDYKAINHRAYFVAPSDGTYTFTATNFNDGVFMWIGDKAFNGLYTRANADMVAIYRQTAKSFKKDLKAKSYTPFRVLFVNGPAEATFVFSITAPDDTVLFDNTDVTSTPFFIPYTCDNSYPAFEDFGSETGVVQGDLGEGEGTDEDGGDFP